MRLPLNEANVDSLCTLGHPGRVRVLGPSGECDLVVHESLASDIEASCPSHVLGVPGLGELVSQRCEGGQVIYSLARSHQRELPRTAQECLTTRGGGLIGEDSRDWQAS
jgi:hypothetical protein